MWRECLGLIVAIFIVVVWIVYLAIGREVKKVGRGKNEKI